MLFLLTGLIVAGLTKSTVKDVPAKIKELRQKKIVLEMLRKAPEDKRDGVPLVGTMYATIQQLEHLRDCPSKCGEVVRDMRIQGDVMVPLFFHQCQNCGSYTDGQNMKTIDDGKDLAA